ncbi:MAG: triose-phosphate isomerase [Leptospiraceae bacterium]|nr:triose-phosphate isomerase [Leptospiraceae bacterium]MCK6379781.1 triose-phosphate isomerase [Leptospiraceae bacterium]NUM42285.1 triose-phosphate isomerase [Leptospiraceae bacterium]
MRTKIIAGNWKMNLNRKEVETLSKGIKEGFSVKKYFERAIVFPSSIHIPKVTETLSGSGVEVGVQNIYPSNLSAFTGEISTDQIKDFGIKYALIGHSERRQFLKESNEFLNMKLLFCLKEGITPIYCIGETLEERESGKTFEILKSQIVEGLKNISPSDSVKLILAYEPVWAIGTGKVASPEQAEEAHDYIRKQISEIFGQSQADSISILYGGSVKPDNVKALLEKPNIDGGLVGGASQKVDSFLGLFSN